MSQLKAVAEKNNVKLHDGVKLDELNDKGKLGAYATAVATKISALHAEATSESLKKAVALAEDFLGAVTENSKATLLKQYKTQLQGSESEEELSDLLTRVVKDGFIAVAVEIINKGDSFRLPNGANQRLLNSATEQLINDGKRYECLSLLKDFNNKFGFETDDLATKLTNAAATNKEPVLASNAFALLSYKVKKSDKNARIETAAELFNDNTLASKFREAVSPIGQLKATISRI